MYLFSTRSEPHGLARAHRALLRPNSKKLKHDYDHDNPQGSTAIGGSRQAVNEKQATDTPSSDSGSDGDSSDQPSDADNDESTTPRKFRAPVILPSARYRGAANVETVKDGLYNQFLRVLMMYILTLHQVNFLGLDDEFITSGSDDGNFFIWHKDNTKLSGIYEGDSSVVNVIEGHPRLPIVAVSGIDTTIKVSQRYLRLYPTTNLPMIKLFAPTTWPSVHSRMDEAEDIISSNEENVKVSRQFTLLGYLRSRVLSQVRSQDGENFLSDGEDEDDSEGPPCPHQ